MFSIFDSHVWVIVYIFLLCSLDCGLVVVCTPHSPLEILHFPVRTATDGFRLLTAGTIGDLFVGVAIYLAFLDSRNFHTSAQ